ncbi:hypothetical protein EYM_01170 [Ignicoccus islandicus DSM 13165]|uniref:polynucleotide 5'-hydroxyl-kinase n=1 Tax=Ignicoccus islandicus DSM 13165 TaxID=940295 RepID=A0A0U3FQL8_9CREN|nr:Clp1/GlmU family protein [Ignicoccus islandicus]ALU12183.1 hypothetical protein EYM_01170 [Ignicoccus islandicus DSM 13165]
MDISERNVEVPNDKFLEISGPAVVRVREGKGKLMGRELSPADIVIVPAWRTYAIRAVTPLKLSVSVSATSELRVVDFNIAKVWEEALAKRDLSRVVIVGPTDSGKSSLVATITNLLISKGADRVTIVNTDVGQSNFCPPTMVCKTEVTDYVFTLQDLEPTVTKFTGTITPAVEQSRVIAATASLVNGDYVMDTDGWVEGWDAAHYKRSLLQAVKPKLVIYLGKAPKWLTGPWEVISLPPSTGRARDREDRRFIRKVKYAKALGKCGTLELNLNEVPPLYSVTFNSPWSPELRDEVEELIGTRPLLAFSWRNKVVAVVKKGSKYFVPRGSNVIVIEEGEEKGLLVALGDEEGNEVLGMVQKIDYLSKFMKVKSCFNGTPKYVSFGRVKLDEEFRDSVVNKPF